MTFDPTTIIAQAQSIDLSLILKIFLLSLIALYAVFSFMLFSQIRSLDKIVFFPSGVPGFFMKEFALFYFLAVTSLFLLTFVIL